MEKVLYIIAGANGSGKTTLSGKYLISIVKQAKQKGFKVILIYLFLSKETENILRVRNRVLNGGHDVPLNDIIRRYFRSRELFHVYKKLVDKWIMFYNGDDNYELVAEDNEIFDSSLYNIFIRGN